MQDQERLQSSDRDVKMDESPLMNMEDYNHEQKLRCFTNRERTIKN